MKCAECDKKAVVVLNGNSICAEHMEIKKKQGEELLQYLFGDL